MIINFDITKTYEEQPEEIKLAIPKNIYYEILKGLGCVIKIEIPKAKTKPIGKFWKFCHKIIKTIKKWKTARLNGTVLNISQCRKFSN